MTFSHETITQNFPSTVGMVLGEIRTVKNVPASHRPKGTTTLRITRRSKEHYKVYEIV